MGEKRTSHAKLPFLIRALFNVLRSLYSLDSRLFQKHAQTCHVILPLNGAHIGPSHDSWGGPICAPFKGRITRHQLTKSHADSCTQINIEKGANMCPIHRKDYTAYPNATPRGLTQTHASSFSAIGKATTSTLGSSPSNNLLPECARRF